MSTRLNLRKRYFHISTFRHLGEDFLNHPDRKLYFEIYWVNNEAPLHFVEDKKMTVKGDWMYLVPPFRNYHFDKTDKDGTLIAFNKDVLMYEAKESSLNIYNLFNRHGDFTTFFVDQEVSKSLTAILDLIKDEYTENRDNVLLLRTLLKAFLLKIMYSAKQQLINPELNEKRVYHFLLLLENHYISEKKVDFYAEKLNLSSKRLNQILKKKLGKTINQLLQERLLIEAKHLLFAGKENIKEISFSLGFHDSSYFSRFFKKMTNLSPEEFRTTIKNKISLNP